MMSDLGGFLTEVARRPSYSSLRRVLLAGVLIQLILAPLTSWGYDTPTFVQTADYTLFSGNPYSSGLWFNPPLGPYLAVPFMAVWNLVSGGAAPVVSVTAFYPLSQVGTLGTLVPSPGALLAWKLPLIIANLVTSLGLVALLRHQPRVKWSPAMIAGAWMLNPLVIWVAAIHGEVDILAVGFVIASLICLSRERWVLAGGLLGLAIMAKAFPAVMLPAIAVYLVFVPAPGLTALRARLTAAIGFASGLIVTVLPFYPLFPHIESILLVKYANPAYGALSPTVIFNAAAPKGFGPYHAFVSQPANGQLFLYCFDAMAILAVVGGAALLAYRLRRGNATGPDSSIALLALVGAWAVGAVLLTNPSPNAENLIDLLGPLFVALPLFGGRRLRWLIGGLSVVGLGQYFSFVTPVGYFQPLAVLLGPGAIRFFNGVTTGFIYSGQRGWIWLVEGLVGGTLLLAVWGFSAWRLAPRGFRVRLRRLARRIPRSLRG